MGSSVGLLDMRACVFVLGACAYCCLVTRKGPTGAAASPTPLSFLPPTPAWLAEVGVGWLVRFVPPPPPPLTSSVADPSSTPGSSIGTAAAMVEALGSVVGRVAPRRIART